jgi:alanine racemase
VCIDTGMRRFACPMESAAAVVAAGSCSEVFTHAVTAAHARQLVAATQQLAVLRHAAASSLVGVPAARLDAVRPGLLLYRGAVRVSAPLVEVGQVRRGIGYSGFRASRHGVIMAGYAHGLRLGWCLVNGRRRRIREIGMQTTYVDIGAGDAVGDDVVLLGDGLTEDDLAPAWAARPHEVLTTLCGSGERIHRHRPQARRAGPQ